MRYRELKKELETIYSDLPIFYAFNKEQLKEGMKKLGVKDGKELYQNEIGGFYKKTDSKKIQETTDKMSKMLEDFIKDKDQLADALSYELANHEYCITGDVYDALSAFNLSYDKLNTMQKEALKIAIEQQEEDL